MFAAILFWCSPVVKCSLMLLFELQMRQLLKSAMQLIILMAHKTVTQICCVTVTSQLIRKKKALQCRALNVHAGSTCNLVQTCMFPSGWILINLHLAPSFRLVQYFGLWPKICKTNDFYHVFVIFCKTKRLIGRYSFICTPKYQYMNHFFLCIFHYNTEKRLISYNLLWSWLS